MAPLALVTGPAGSGKSEHILARLASRYMADPLACTLVLVPTVRHGDQFRRRLVAKAGAAFGLTVATVPQWSRGVVAAAVPPRGVLAAWLERVISEAIRDGSAAYFAPLPGTSGLRRLVETAVGELLADEVAPAAFAVAAAGDPRLAALAAVYARLRADLESRGWLHPAMLPGVAAAALAPEAVPPLVVADGFQVLRRGEVALLAALARHAEVVVAFDPGASPRAASDLEALRTATTCTEQRLDAAPPAPRRTAASAPDREAQLREIAGEVKALLTADASLRPSDCAVAFRQVVPYLGLARQVFREYDLPLDPAAGDRLAARPLGVWLRRLLHLAAEGWRLRDLAAVLASDFVDLAPWGLEPRHVGSIVRTGRERHLWSGPAVTETLVEALRLATFADVADPDAQPIHALLREQFREAADGLATAVGTLRAMIEPPPATLRDHARRLDGALFGSGALVSPAARAIDGAGVEIDALRSMLRSIAAADEALEGPSVAFAEFVARVEAELEALAVLLREPGGVLLAPLHTLHGLRFAYLAVGGLVEGEFPARRTTTTLLDSEARSTLAAAGLAIPPEARAAEDALWESVQTRADGVLSLWRSRLDERGRPAPPSYYFGEETPEADAAVPGAASHREAAIEATRGWLDGRTLRPARLDAWPVVREAVLVEQQRRSSRSAGAFEGQLAPQRLDWLTGSEVSWSATRLEAHRTCPFLFFGRYALHLRELDEELDGADAATRGTVLHDILDAVLAPLRDAGLPLAPATVEEAVGRLATVGRALWDQAPAKHGFGRAGLWRLDGEEVLRQTEALLRREAAENATVTRIRGTEEWLTAALPLDPPLRVGSRIDRLDDGPGLAVVVDYKTGKPIERRAVESGRYLQLQLYAHLAREATGADRVIARYAFLRADAKRWALDTAVEADAALVEDAIRVAGEVRAAIEDGNFRVQPSDGCPTWCALRTACRRNEATPWKRWD